MLGVTDDSHELDPPPPPRLLRDGPGFGYTPMRRRPAPVLAGEEWTRDWIRGTNLSPPRTLFEVPVRSTSTEDDDINTWWFAIPQELRTDDFWKHMFAQPEFFLVDKKIDPEQKEAIDTIMSLLPIGYKGIYDTASRRHHLKNPFPKKVNVAYVKQYLNNVRTTLSLTPEDRYRFEMILMNYLMFAPMKVLEKYIARLLKRGGKTRRNKTRKHKSKRI